ncbi:MAG TPA: hypothetical protein VIL20_27405 [Sandaracinaceae bacterium]
MSAPVELASGGSGEAVAWAGEVLSLVLPRAFAPGAPIAFSIALEGGALSLSGKTVGSKRRADGRFDVRVRLLNLRREERARLEALAPARRD